MNSFTEATLVLTNASLVVPSTDLKSSFKELKHQKKIMTFFGLSNSDEE